MVIFWWDFFSPEAFHYRLYERWNTKQLPMIKSKPEFHYKLYPASNGLKSPGYGARGRRGGGNASGLLERKVNLLLRHAIIQKPLASHSDTQEQERNPTSRQTSKRSDSLWPTEDSVRPNNHPQLLEHVLPLSASHLPLSQREDQGWRRGERGK